MSELNSQQQVNEGLESAKLGAELEAKAGKEAAKRGYKAGKWLAKGGAKKVAAGGKAAGGFIAANPYIAIGLIVVLLILLVVSPTQGQISSTYRDTDRKTAINEKSNYNYPDTAEEEEESINNKDLAVENTRKLASIIHESKQEDYERVRQYALNSVETAAKRAARDGKEVDVDLSVQMASTEFTERSHLLWEGSQLDSSEAEGGPNPDDFVSDKTKIGQATSGDNGLTGNKAGDQSGSEVSTANVGNNWTHVFRITDDKKKLVAANFAKEACANDHIGYDQGHPDRSSFYNEASKVSWTASRITADCECSCTELITASLRAAGFSKSEAPTPLYSDAGGSDSNRDQVLGRVSGLQKITFKKGMKLYPGDIMCRAHHTAIVISSPNRVNVTYSSGGGSVGQRAVDWARARAEESKKGKWYYVHFGSSGYWHGVKQSTECPLCKPDKASKGWQCIGFVTAAYFHGAGVPSGTGGKKASHCHLGGFGSGGPDSAPGTLDGSSPEAVFRKWKRQNGKNWEMISTGSLKSGSLKASQLQPGDILICYYNSGRFYHMALYAGNNQYIDSSSGNQKYNGIKGGIQVHTYGNRKSVRIAMRYTGKGSSSATAQKSGRSSTSRDVINGACAWAEAIAADDSFHYGIVPNARHNGCYFCGTNKASVKKGVLDYKKSYICTSFVTAAFAHGGGEPAMLKVCRRGSSFGFGTSGANTYHKSSLFENLGKPKFSTLQKGDVLCGSDHVALYLGNNKIVEAGGGGDDNKRNSKKWNNSIRVKKQKSWGRFDRAYRYIGNGGGTMELPGDASSSIAGSSSGAASMTPQKYRTILKKIKKSTGTRYALSSSGNTAQSFVFGDGKFYVQRISPGRYGHGGFFEAYDRSAKLLKTGKHISALGHGNGLGYKNGKLYSIWAGANRDKRTVQLIDPGTLKYEGQKKTKNAASGIGYDKETDCWALNQRNSIVIYDGSLSERKKTITKKGSHGADYVQDCMAAGGVVYAVIHLDGKNYIDLYRETDGEYLGSYTAEGAELEGVTMTEENELVLLFHSSGSREYIQYTGITIETGDSGEKSILSDYISSHDMDILAAYNISIANAATYMESKENTSNDPKEVWLNKNAYYTDISGKKVKIYWEDKKRGLIDYEKDLRKKADAWFKGFIDVSTVTSDSSASTPSGSSSSSAWNLMLVNPAHAMPDDYSSGLTNINEKYLTNNDKWRNRIDTRVYDSLVKMMDDCKEAVGSKHAPLICSAFRTRDMQQELYDSTANKDDTAVPGHSEHECGLAVDIVDKTYQTLDDAQADTKAQKWLMSHCQDYGFILRYPKGKQDITGIIWEPWHYRYVGKKNAKEIMSKGLTLEEYLGDTGASEESSGASSAPTPSEEEMSSDKHFFKVVVGTVPEKVGDTYILPVTIKEKEVNELMDPLFGVKPNDVYVNSQSETQAKAEEKEKQTSALTSTNLTAVYDLSDSTGFTVFESQIYSQNIGFNTEADGAFGIQVIGTAQQKAIINQITRTWPLNGKNPYNNGYHGLCLKWVVDIYNGAGFSACGGQSVCCASKHRDLFAHKNKNIPPGAMIYSGSKYRSSCTCECGRNAGHVAIYLGNNKVAGSQSPYVMSLDQWTKIFGYGGWSFGGNKF